MADLDKTTKFYMNQGDTKYIRITCYASTGTPIDLSTASDMNFAVRQYGYSNSSALITKTISNITIENTNTALIKLLPADTQSISGKFQYHFKLEDASGDSFSIQELFIIETSIL